MLVYVTIRSKIVLLLWLSWKNSLVSVSILWSAHNLLIFKEHMHVCVTYFALNEKRFQDHNFFMHVSIRTRNVLHNQLTFPVCSALARDQIDFPASKKADKTNRIPIKEHALQEKPHIYFKKHHQNNKQPVYNAVRYNAILI